MLLLLLLLLLGAMRLLHPEGRAGGVTKSEQMHSGADWRPRTTLVPQNIRTHRFLAPSRTLIATTNTYRSCSTSYLIVCVDGAAFVDLDDNALVLPFLHLHCHRLYPSDHQQSAQAPTENSQRRVPSRTARPLSSTNHGGPCPHQLPRVEQARGASVEESAGNEVEETLPGAKGARARARQMFSIKVARRV